VPDRAFPGDLAVIRDAMTDKDRVALARIVFAHREHIIALEPLGKGLLGTTLRYDDEVEAPEPRPEGDNVIDLMDALRNSVKGRKAARPRKQARKRKAA
jgi:non-homologous end joining protein Ku